MTYKLNLKVLSYHSNQWKTTNYSDYNSLSSCLLSNRIINSKVNNNVSSCKYFSTGKRDYYEVLGVAKGSQKGLIKKAYFSLAKKYHPDANRGDTTAAEKFKEVTEAYEVLSDERKRELYDTYGHAGIDPNMTANGNGFHPFGQAGGFDFGNGSFHFQTNMGSGGIDAEDIFDAFFGGGRKKSRGPKRGSDLQIQVQLTFYEAAFGTKKNVPLRYQIRNPRTGRVQLKERDVSIDIPAGIDSNVTFQIDGQGVEGEKGAANGNLLVTPVVEEDPENYFQRNGTDIHVEVPISITKAVLGGIVDVKTLTGDVTMKIPKGCQPDSKLLLRGRGIPSLQGNSKGDQIVHLRIKIPKYITSRQEELLQEFEEENERAKLGFKQRFVNTAKSTLENLFPGDQDNNINKTKK